ncbi:CLUMA_CG010328, isoform A [Clunio marinus]|uniref:CLUMA_CG010328, isoform A n=1 Tax=Clunio marinus TaxID=568069 RepID=A0A1J1IBI0_9DIPT|nr:CLUMA_CG010328, isoform A [Clunio marinus]
MLTDFVKNFCPKILRDVNESENIKKLCHDWLEIAFNFCIDKIFNKESTSQRIWKWILNFVSQKRSIEPFIETKYKSYFQSPTNLTATECVDVFRTIYDDFQKITLNEASEQSLIKTQSANIFEEKNSIEINYFILIINVLLIASFMVVMFAIKKMKRNFEIVKVLRIKDTIRNGDSQHETEILQISAPTFNSLLDELEMTENSVETTAEALEGSTDGSRRIYDTLRPLAISTPTLKDKRGLTATKRTTKRKYSENLKNEENTSKSPSSNKPLTNIDNRRNSLIPVRAAKKK